MRSLDALPIAGESSGERDFMSGTLYLPGGEDKILLAADRHRSVTGLLCGPGGRPSLSRLDS